MDLSSLYFGTGFDDCHGWKKDIYHTVKCWSKWKNYVIGWDYYEITKIFNLIFADNVTGVSTNQSEVVTFLKDMLKLNDCIFLDNLKTE